jgi:aryl-alcohol dehydrogenase-like predicted oxidoreductase
LAWAVITWAKRVMSRSIRIVRSALDNGVNFLDDCWDYNGGTSEERMGKALREGYRQKAFQKAFLMTKIDGPTKKAANQQLEDSLRRLQTDHVDLLQFHEIIRHSDPARIFRPHLRRGRRDGGSAGCQERGEDSLYRVHWT